MRRIFIGIAFFISHSLTAQEEQSKWNFLEHVSAYLSTGLSNGLSNPQTTDLPGVVSYNCMAKKSSVTAIGIGYKISKVGVEVSYELCSYRVKGGKTILFIPGKEYPFAAQYPNFEVIDILNDPLKKRYYQSNFLIGLNYKIPWRKFTLEPMVKAGATSFKAIKDKVFLKEIGSNYTKEESYNPQESMNFILKGGLRLKLTMLSRLDLFIADELSYTNLNIKYKIQSIDVYNAANERIEEGRQAILLNSFTVGLSLAFAE